MSDARVNDYGQPIGAEVSHWSARPRPVPCVLSGRYCRIEPVDVARHATELLAAYSRAPDDRDWTYLFAQRPQTLEAMRDYLAKLAASEDPLHYAIIDVASETAVGTAALMRIEPLHGVIEIGSIAFSPQLMRTRAATESMFLLMRYAMDVLGYRRYEWKCDRLNAPSRAAAQRYGFTFEGIFRKAVIYKGRSRDTAWYSIIDEEWRLIRQAFEAWLDPLNFDEHGRQRRALAALRGRAATEESTLVPLDPQQLPQLMSWFATEEAVNIWGGVGFRFPFTAASFAADAKLAELASFTLIAPGGRLLGFGQYYLREGRCHLGRLVIDPQLRSGGLGRRLIALLAAAGAARLNCTECSLFVLQRNERATQLYTRLGFACANYPPPGRCVPNSLYMVAPLSRLTGG